MPTRKQRGYDTERLVAVAWQTDGWPHAEVVRGQGADLTGTPGIACEIKARREFAPVEWMRQAASHTHGRAGTIAVVIVRPDGAGPATVDDWPAILPHAKLRQLLREAGYGTPNGDRP